MCSAHTSLPVDSKTNVIISVIFPLLSTHAHRVSVTFRIRQKSMITHQINWFNIYLFGVTSVALGMWKLYVSWSSYICLDGGMMSRVDSGMIFDSPGLEHKNGLLQGCFSYAYIKCLQSESNQLVQNLEPYSITHFEHFHDLLQGFSTWSMKQIWASKLT